MPPWVLAVAGFHLIISLGSLGTHISVNITCICPTDTFSLGNVSAQVSDATRSMIERWAPKMWVHHEEVFRPSNVEYFLQNTRVSSMLVLSDKMS